MLIAVAAVNVPCFARNIRGVTVAIVHLNRRCSRLNGPGHFSIIVEVVPNVVPTIVIAVSTGGLDDSETAGLSFLGLWSQPRRRTWAQC